MRTGYRRQARGIRAVTAGAIVTGGVLLATTAEAGAAAPPTFGAPSGFSCAGVGLSQGPQSTFNSLGLPVYAWNGLPLLGIIVDPNKVGKEPLLGPSCGDLGHGSSEIGLAGRAATTFAKPVGSVVGATSTVHTNKFNPLMTILGQSAYVYAQTNQSAVVTPKLAAGDTSITISVTYTILSSTTTGPLGSLYGVTNSATTSLSYASTAASPSCNGQPALAAQTGDFSATAPGTYTAQSEFSCPAGETLTESQPLDVVFSAVQSGWFQAGAAAASYAGSITAQPDSVTVTVGH